MAHEADPYASDHDILSCPVCDRRYRYKPTLEGKKVRCPQCRAKLRLPPGERAFEVVEQPPEPDPYEMDEAPTAPHGSGKFQCPACGTMVKATAAICVHCGYDLEHNQQLQTKVDKGGRRRDDPHPAAPAAASTALGAGGPGFDADALAAETEAHHRRHEVTYPLILVGVAVGLLLINGLVLFPAAIDANAFAAIMNVPASRLGQAWAYLQSVGVRTVTQIPLLLVGIFATAAIFSSNYGTLGRAMIKLLALALLVGGFEDGLYLIIDIATGGFGGIGFLLVGSLSIGLFILLAMALFDMDAQEAVVLWLITLLGPMAVELIIKPTLHAWGIPVI